jgi:hypothetical protein
MGYARTNVASKQLSGETDLEQVAEFLESRAKTGSNAEIAGVI